MAHKTYAGNDRCVVDMFDQLMTSHGQDRHLVDLFILKYKRANDLETQTMVGLVDRAGRLLSKVGFLLLTRQEQQTTPRMMEALVHAGFEKTLQLEGDAVLYSRIYSAEPSPNKQNRCIETANFGKGCSVPPHLEAALREHAFELVHNSPPFKQLSSSVCVIACDDVKAPLLTNISSEAWSNLKTLVLQHRRVLWITHRSQVNVANPNNGLIFGLFRAIRSEDPRCQLITLDVEDDNSSGSISAIVALLQHLEQHPDVWSSGDCEFTERGGVIYVSRLVIDDTVNQQLKKTDEEEQIIQPLQNLKSVIRLKASNTGPRSFDSLHYVQESVEEAAIRSAHIEVDIFAVGLNIQVSKSPSSLCLPLPGCIMNTNIDQDILVTTGAVSGDEHVLGQEAAGVVRRVGSAVDSYKIGDRVAVIKPGCIANRIQVPVKRAVLIPETLSFESAASVPLAFITVIYVLHYVACMTKGQVRR